VETRVSIGEATGRANAGRADLPIASKPDEIGELFVRGSFLPNRHTLGDLSKGAPLVMTAPNGDWYSTGVSGYFDDQSRFWLTERTAR
jgi:hypothetical protein